MLEYFTSAQFFETFIVLLFGILVILGSITLDRKQFKPKATNKKWYHSAKMIIDFVNSVIIILLILLILSINGVNVGEYVKSLGVLGIILSFALQDLLKDVIMGLSIMFEGYFKVGDVIEFGDDYAKVISFNIKSTRLFMIGSEATVTVSNRNFSQVAIVSDWIDILVPIGYDVDLYRSRNLCRECAKRIERLRYVYSCDFLNTQELAESWINYKLRVHCLPEKKPMVLRNSNAVIQDVFYENDQEFPLNILILQNADTEAQDKRRIEGVEKVQVNETEIRVNSEQPKHKKRFDYELGRGAAQSKKCSVDGSDKTLAAAITEVERYTSAENLEKGTKLRIRLLSEELLSLVSGLPRMKEGSFYIEREGTDYAICFDADAKISKETREKLVSVSSTNVNDAYIGLSGVFTHAIDSMMAMSINDQKGISKSSMDTMEQSIGKAENDYRWSYNIYKEKENENLASFDNEDIINEDEIGKSVLTSLSDDIRISVRTKHVNIRVLAKSDDGE